MPDLAHPGSGADPPAGGDQKKRDRTLILIGVIGVIVSYLIYRRMKASQANTAPITPVGTGTTTGATTSGSSGSGSSTDFTSQLTTLQAALSSQQAQEQTDMAALTAQLEQQKNDQQSALAQLQASLAADLGGAHPGGAPIPGWDPAGQLFHPATDTSAGLGDVVPGWGTVVSKGNGQFVIAGDTTTGHQTFVVDPTREGQGPIVPVGQRIAGEQYDANGRVIP